ncbi:MAG: DUF86 domain-containing protein [Calditrichaeota bacterium]|nr:MAG: DUF86 domain-containing protein [Calditrichota bacterium]
MKKDETYLIDILDSAKIAVSYLENFSQEKFNSDYKTQDAVIRRLEIIGEASSKVSETGKEIYSDLPWREMKSMRNFLIHEYDDVDFEVVWETVKTNLPPLIKQLEKIL